MMLWAPLLYCALVCLCLSMERHQRQVFANGAPRFVTAWLRPMGGLTLATSLAFCVGGSATALACVYWFCAIAALGSLLNLTLVYRPRWVPASVAAALCACLTSALSRSL